MDLNDDNFMLYAAKKYDQPHIATAEFLEELQRLKYVKRLLRKYRATGDLRERLLLNHVIVLGNIFGPDGACNMLLFKVDDEDRPALKTVLLYLNFWPKQLPYTFNGESIHHDGIPIDMNLANKLRAI
jgi:hypothetical protein